MRKISALLRGLDVGQIKWFSDDFSRQIVTVKLIWTQIKSGCKRNMVRIHNRPLSCSMVKARTSTFSYAFLTDIRIEI